MQEREYYETWIDENNLIRFKTDQNIEYCVTFSDAEGYFFDDNPLSINFITFSFHKANQESKGKSDPKISITLLILIKLYLSNHPTHALLYQCSLQDNQHGARNKMFKNWRNLLTANSYCFIDFQTDINVGEDRTQLYSSLIMREDNSLKSELINTFDLVCEAHNSYKM